MAPGRRPRNQGGTRSKKPICVELDSPQELYYHILHRPFTSQMLKHPKNDAPGHPGPHKSSQVINPLNAFCIVQRADSTCQKKCVLQDYGVFSVAPPTLVGWADCM